MAVMLRVVEIPGLVHRPDGFDPEGAFLASYNLDSADGLGVATYTHDPEKALHFPDIKTAFRVAGMQSVRRPMRSDGLPNRPLRAITWEAVEYRGASR